MRTHYPRSSPKIFLHQLKHNFAPAPFWVLEKFSSRNTMKKNLSQNLSASIFSFVKKSFDSIRITFSTKKSELNRIDHLFFLFFFIGFSLFSKDAMANKTYVYETISHTGKPINTSYIEIKKEANVTNATWCEKENTRATREEFYNFDNLSKIKEWVIHCPKEETNYSGKKENGKVTIQGTFQGKILHKVINIPDEEFFANPKIDMMAFAQSHKNHINFWTIRKDTLEKHKMTAIHKGIEIIDINGVEVKANKIYWKAKFIPDVFFNRTYWFRHSDGIYIKQIGSNKIRRNLINEY